MSAEIPSEFEQKQADGRELSVEGASNDASPSTSGAGYGYGYGYSNSNYGDSELSLAHYLQVLYRRRYVAATAFMLVLLAGALSTFTATRIYEGTTRILIERVDPKVVSFQEVLDQGQQSDDYYETQYQILQSRGLARRTIEDLSLWTHPAFHQAPGFSLRGFLLQPVYMAARWFEPARPASQEAAPADAEETSAQSGVIDQLLQGLTISPIRYSRLVDISFRSTDPALASRIANGVANAYIHQSVEFRSTTTKEASAFLEQQLAEQRKKLEDSCRGTANAPTPSLSKSARTLSSRSFRI